MLPLFAPPPEPPELQPAKHPVAIDAAQNMEIPLFTHLFIFRSSHLFLASLNIPKSNIFSFEADNKYQIIFSLIFFRIGRIPLTLRPSLGLYLLYFKKLTFEISGAIQLYTMVHFFVSKMHIRVHYDISLRIEIELSISL